MAVAGGNDAGYETTARGAWFRHRTVPRRPILASRPPGRSTAAAHQTVASLHPRSNGVLILRRRAPVPGRSLQRPRPASAAHGDLLRRSDERRRQRHRRAAHLQYKCVAVRRSLGRRHGQPIGRRADRRPSPYSGRISVLRSVASLMHAASNAVQFPPPALTSRRQMRPDVRASRQSRGKNAADARPGRCAMFRGARERFPERIPLSRGRRPIGGSGKVRCVRANPRP